MMLHVIQDLSDDFLALIKDDPVRPEIPAEQRVNANSKIFVLKDDRKHRRKSGRNSLKSLPM